MRKARRRQLFYTWGDARRMAPASRLLNLHRFLPLHTNDKMLASAAITFAKERKAVSLLQE